MQISSALRLSPLCFEVRSLCWVPSVNQVAICYPCDRHGRVNKKLRLFLPSGAAVSAFVAEGSSSGSDSTAFRFPSAFQKRDISFGACVVLRGAKVGFKREKNDRNKTNSHDTACKKEGEQNKKNDGYRP